MGEFAYYLGERVKIGTCEDMYYLRAEQARDVQPGEDGLNVWREREQVRFRFPWPDEDGTAPGAYVDHNRSLRLEGIEPPEELADEHSTVQFSARNGYLASLPCPESGKVAYTNDVCGPGAPAGRRPLKVHRNGYGGAVHLIQQRWVEHDLVAVVRCGGCGMAWRLETLADVQPALDWLETTTTGEHGERVHPRPRVPTHPYVEIARRIRAGYTNGGSA